MASSKSAALFADDTKCYRSIESMEDGASTTLTNGVISAWQVDLNQSKCGLLSITRNATTSCKNVKTLPRKNDLSCFKSLLITGLWDIILTSLLPSIQSCSSKFWVWPCIASNFDKGWRGGHKHKIMDRPFMAKYGSVSSTFATGCSPFHFPYQLSDVQVKTSEAQKYLRVLGTFF